MIAYSHQVVRLGGEVRSRVAQHHRPGNEGSTTAMPGGDAPGKQSACGAGFAAANAPVLPWH